MTNLTLLAHASGTPHAHVEGFTVLLIALALLALGLSWRKTV